MLVLPEESEQSDDFEEIKPQNTQIKQKKVTEIKDQHDISSEYDFFEGSSFRSDNNLRLANISAQNLEDLLNDSETYLFRNTPQ